MLHVTVISKWLKYRVRHFEQCMGSCLAFCHILLYLHCFSYEDNYAVAYELTLGGLSVNLYWFGSKFVNGLSKFSAVCLKHRQKEEIVYTSCLWRCVFASSGNLGSWRTSPCPWIDYVCYDEGVKCELIRFCEDSSSLIRTFIQGSKSNSDYMLIYTEDKTWKF